MAALGGGHEAPWMGEPGGREGVYDLSRQSGEGKEEEEDDTSRQSSEGKEGEEEEDTSRQPGEGEYNISRQPGGEASFMPAIRDVVNTRNLILCESDPPGPVPDGARLSGPEVSTTGQG